MCAIIGAYLQNPNEESLVLLANVFRESSIRGLHATGVSWVQDNQIKTVIEGKPAKEFLRTLDLNNCINEDGNLYLIGHCRYSTSDLQFNQPLYNEDISIVHNGVVSQEMPERWEELYGYKCKTRNDSELILRALEAGKSPLEEYSNSSMAVIELYREKKIRFYRNGKRPIHYTILSNGMIVTSTGDIAIRAGLIHWKVQAPEPATVSMNEYITVSSKGMTISSVEIPNAKDLQP